MFSVRMRASRGDTHISGAEGMCKESNISTIAGEYLKRALTHPRGKPDEVFITIEKIIRKPKKIPMLPVKTLECNSPADARKIITDGLLGLGISQGAISRAFKVLKSKKTMRGASLIRMRSGRRAEPDKERGVRVSKMGIEKPAEKKLAQRLSRMKINTTRLRRVKEALMLASKVASCPDVIAEVCISDDPDYATGYIASKKSGYLRIPNIKKKKEMHGGRAFFIKEAADIDMLVDYLEKKPAIIAI